MRKLVANIIEYVLLTISLTTLVLAVVFMFNDSTTEFGTILLLRSEIRYTLWFMFSVFILIYFHEKKSKWINKE